MLGFSINASYGQTTPKQSQKTQNKQSLNLGFTAEDIINESAPVSPDELARVNAKKRRYDISDNSSDPKWSRDLTKLADRGISRAGNSETPYPAPLPSEQSTKIVVGKIAKVQPYLTDSKTALFTEFAFEVEDVLKTDDPAVVRGAVINFDREAGALCLANGQLIRYDGEGMGKLPRTGRRYLLFLKPIHNGQDTTVEVGYELQNGQVSPLLESFVYTPQTREITKRSPFAGTGELQFIQLVRDNVAGLK